MSALTWAVCCAIAVVCLAPAIRWGRRYVTSAVQVERASRPPALGEAELIYVEEQFRISEPVDLVAKIDRAYRMPSGLIVLVELKTRWKNRPFLSDLIQLSAQRTAMIGQTRQAVASYAYVIVKAPTKRASPTAHRIELMTDLEVAALVKRREDILAERVLPSWPKSRKPCLGCAFHVQCDRSIH